MQQNELFNFVGRASNYLHKLIFFECRNGKLFLPLELFLYSVQFMKHSPKKIQNLYKFNKVFTTKSFPQFCQLFHLSTQNFLWVLLKFSMRLSNLLYLLKTKKLNLQNKLFFVFFLLEYKI